MDSSSVSHTQSLDANLPIGSKKQGSGVPLTHFLFFVTFPDQNDPSSFYEVLRI